MSKIFEKYPSKIVQCSIHVQGSLRSVFILVFDRCVDLGHVVSVWWPPQYCLVLNLTSTIIDDINLSCNDYTFLAQFHSGLENTTIEVQNLVTGRVDGSWRTVIYQLFVCRHDRCGEGPVVRRWLCQGGGSDSVPKPEDQARTPQRVLAGGLLERVQGTSLTLLLYLMDSHLLCLESATHATDLIMSQCLLMDISSWALERHKLNIGFYINVIEVPCRHIVNVSSTILELMHRISLVYNITFYSLPPLSSSSSL